MISVGIDVSKDKSMVCFMKPGGEILIKPFEILHTTTDVDNLINLINNFNEEVKVVLESTGHYHLPVMIRLRDNNIFVCIVNALRMKKYCSQNIRRAKTDRIDSIHIASFGLTYWNELIPARETNSVYNELQLLSRQYYQLTSMIVKAKINLNNLIDKVMPGLQKALNDNKYSNRLSEFVKKYKHSDVIKR